MKKNIQAEIKGIIEEAAQRIINALSKLPPSQWPTKVKRKATRAPAAEREERKSSKRPVKRVERVKRSAITKKKAEAAEPAGCKKRSLAKMNALRDKVVHVVRDAYKSAPDDGISAGSIARAVRRETSEIVFPLDTLRAKGVLRLEGERSKARWFPTAEGMTITREQIDALFPPAAKKASPPVDAEGSPATATPEAATGTSEPTTA